MDDIKKVKRFFNRKEGSAQNVIPPSCRAAELPPLLYLPFIIFAILFERDFGEMVAQHNVPNIMRPT